MNYWLTRVFSISLLVLLAACTTAPKKDLALERVRDELDNLKSNPELAGLAPLALGEAERALRSAESATGDDLYRAYLVYMADRRIHALGIYRPLLQCAQHTGKQLVFVKRLTRTITFDNARHNQFGSLVSSKTLTAIDTFASPAHLRTFTGQP